MLSYLISFVVLLASLFVAEKMLDDMKIKGGASSYVIVGVLFGVLNTVLGPALYHAIGIGTLGLGYLFGFITRWVVMGLVLKFVGGLTDRLEVKTFRTAFVAALLMSLTTGACEILLDLVND